MKKQIVSTLLALCMLLCLMPTAVLAADEVSAKVNGIAVPAAGGSITGEGISGSVVFDASAKTLTLENATISVTTEEKAIDIRGGIDTLILKGKNEIKWADESDKKTSICAISASSSSFLIKGNSREDSLTVTLPGTKGGYKYAYAISMGSGEIRNCSVDITVIGGMQNAGDNVAIRVSGGNFKIKDAALNLTVGKDRKGNVQNAKQGACVFATGRISIENSYINAGIYSALGQGAAYYATLQGQGGITCTDSVIYAESDVLKAGRTICLDGGDTTFSVKNSIFNAKGNQYAVYGYKYAKPTFENSLVELASEDVVMCGPTFGTISGFTKITATDKNGRDTTYKPGDDLSTLSTDSRKVVIESQIHSHCVCGGENAAEGHTVHSPLMWTPWTKTDSLPTAAGNYYLTGNVLLKSNSDYSMPDGVQICLNGYAIRGVGGTNKPKLYANAGTLTVTDCGTKGSIGNVMMSSGELFMYGGSIPEGSELVIGKNGAFNAANGGGIDGKVTNGGVIFGGIFDGEAVNDGGTIKGGTFNGRVNLKRGNVIGGIYYGRVTYGGAVIRDSACRYLTFDTDGGSAMDAQRVLRGQKATLPTETPVKTGYIFSGWTGFDYTKPMLENAGATAIWTVCDHSGNTKQLSCTEPVACSVCGGTIADGKDVTGYTYGVGATLPTADDMTYTGHTFKGWYDNESLTGSPVTAIGDTETGNKEYWAKWEINQYTITVKPENGKADITITQDYGTPITAPTLTREGYQFNGWDKAFPTTMPAEDLTITAQWRDIAVPTGEIKIAENDWKSFLNTITFGLFFKDTQTVTVTATDNSGETVTIEYLLSEKALAESELAGMTFTAYSAPFSINPDNEYVIYAKLTDTSGNVAYINTNGIVLDGTSPVITGIEAGKTYCAAQIVTVDEKYIDTVTVNDKTVTLDSNHQFTLNPAEGEQTIVATDKAGNETRATVTVNDGHTYEWQSENGQYWQKCKFGNHETAKKDIPTINISGANKVCRTQDYKFSFTLPEGATDAAYGYEFIGLGDGPLTPTVENGLYSGIIKASAYLAEETGFKLIVSAKTADGFEFSAEKTVAIQNEHSGGTATCTNKAVCEICGESYGELNANNHSDLKHFPAVAATKTAEGNIEYWYCSGCKKYYKDAKATQEITKAQTVTAKLPSDNNGSNNKPGNNATTSPQTGDNSNFALWIALLFISGGAVTVTTVYGRKKKHSVK